MQRVPFPRVPPAERRRSIVTVLYPSPDDDRPSWVGERLLRPGQVAELFQVSRRTVSDWARAGKIAAIVTPGGHRRFRMRDVRALIEAHKVEASG